VLEKDGAAEAGRLGESTRFIHCDVGDAAQVRALVEAAGKAFTGDVDVLVNNAGIIHGADFLDLSEADFDRVLRVNLKGAFLMSQAVARRMVAQVAAGRPPGAIVNMSSVNAVVAIPNQLPYCASKAGVAQLTRVAALALAPHGIRVNAIGPGSIMTDMLATVAKDPAVKRSVLSRTPLRRLATPDEVASVAAFLASDDASYITGETVFVDGGRLALNYTVPVPEE
jgi:NAD(P)-dependent dehydrogenase (short-subunit alcohol dehydrogenase family)